MLKSHNRTWNSLVGHTPNVWHIQELFIKQDAEARRAYLPNAVGQDMTTNTGRKQMSLDARERVKFVVDAFNKPFKLNKICNKSFELSSIIFFLLDMSRHSIRSNVI